MAQSPRPKTKWLLYWVVIFGLLAFAVPEVIAIANPESGDTLSESLRWLVFGLPFQLGVIAFLLFLLWFFWHIVIARSRDGDADQTLPDRPEDDGMTPRE